MMIVLLTGLSCSGKTTLANLVKKELIQICYPTEVLDVDICRKCISSNLGFSKENRIVHINRLAFIANILYNNNIITDYSGPNPASDSGVKSATYSGAKPASHSGVNPASDSGPKSASDSGQNLGRTLIKSC